MTTLHLTVDKTGLVTKWDNAEFAQAQTEEAYVKLKLDAAQEHQLTEAYKSLFPPAPPVEIR